MELGVIPHKDHKIKSYRVISNGAYCNGAYCNGTYCKDRMTAIHLDGKFLQCHHTLIKSRLTTDPIGWEEYVNAITQIWGCL